VLAFDSVPEEDFPRLRTCQQLHFFSLPNQINYLLLILQVSNLLGQFFAFTLTNLKDEDLSTLKTRREEIVLDWVKQQTLEFTLHWRAQGVQKLESGVLVLKYFDISFFQSHKQPPIGSIPMNLRDLAGQLQLIDHHTATSVDHIDPSVA
jgi:hypothetical protein